MTSALLPALALLQSGWALPHAGRALNQNELTYFGDCAIVRVDEAAPRTSVRKVETPLGPVDATCMELVVEVVDSTFPGHKKLTLVFVPHFPPSQPARSPGWIDAPVSAGTYFVSGKLGVGESLLSYPGTPGYGFPDTGVHPPVPRMTVPKRSDDEFAVFHFAETRLKRLASGQTEPTSVLRNFAAAAISGTEGATTETAWLLLRTGHDAFPEWRRYAEPAANDLLKASGQQPAVRSALLALTSYKLGSDSHKVGMEGALLKALVAADAADGRFWASGFAPVALQQVNGPVFPSPEERAVLLRPDRQVLWLEALGTCRSEPLRQFMCRNLSNAYAAEMDPAVANVLKRADPAAVSTRMVLERVAEWRAEPEMAPSRASLTGAELLAYWVRKFG